MIESVETRREREAELAPVYAAAINVLTKGFRIGASLLVIGLVVAAARRESLNHEVDSFGRVLPELLDGNAGGIIDLAILAIMMTPLATVVVVAIGFLKAGDRRYGFLSFVVLGVLGISVALALIR